MTRQEEAIIHARAKLPLPSEIECEYITTAVANWELATAGPFVMLPLSRQLTYKKQRIAGIVVGWELETID